MKVFVDGKIYDSTETTIMLVFDDNEKSMFGNLNRFVSAPETSTIEERQKLIDMEL